jgi:nucleoside-diphosphate-sugar epimerase
MRILLTGATGQLGRALVPLLIANGHSLTLLARDAEKAAGLFPGCRVLRGDVALPGLGLTGPARADAVYHMAADVNLGAAQDGRVWAVNYQGTANAVNFCLENSVPRLVYAGTAYTEKGRNSYEKSKKAAEGLVEASGIAQKTIYKIGILVPSETRAAAAPAGAFCQFVGALARVLARLGPDERVLRIKGLPEGRLNLVHTGHAAGFMSRNEAPGRFWLTHPDPVRLAELADWVGQALKARIKFEPEFPMSPAEALFHRLARPFLPYLWDDEFPSDLPGVARVSERFIKETAGAGGGLC